MGKKKLPIISATKPSSSIKLSSVMCQTACYEHEQTPAFECEWQTSKLSRWQGDSCWFIYDAVANPMHFQRGNEIRGGFPMENNWNGIRAEKERVREQEKYLRRFDLGLSNTGAGFLFHWWIYRWIRCVVCRLQRQFNIDLSCLPRLEVRETTAISGGRK